MNYTASLIVLTYLFVQGRNLLVPWVEIYLSWVEIYWSWVEFFLSWGEEIVLPNPVY